MHIEGARVLLTGASGGLGRSIAAELARRGAELTVTGRDERALDHLAHEFGARVVPADLADRDAVSALLDRVGRVDILIANAALPGSGRLVDLSGTDIDRALEVNLRAPMILARELVEPMRKRGSGHLVVMSSLAGKTATPGLSVYNATKFALRGFALALHEELRPEGVGVSVVCPGFVRDAGMFADAGEIALPRGIRTVAPGEVAAAVVRAITHEIAELDVAPASLRFGAKLGAIAPKTAAAIQRWTGADRSAAELAAGQVNKR
ncbi:SDR family NAD(P)-dependent oxidoreductase [Nocardia sp. NPDC057353]|uniref:SDR family NAD(P)-dependent oxidoreductase n=1 Tax=Nocardia sp. NPDC057353 TaxID=3346104 RepID=UPI003629A961